MNGPILAQQGSCIEPSLAFATRPTSTHQSMPESQHQDTLRWQPVNLNTTTSTLPVNARIVYKQLGRVAVIPGDIDMTFFVINSPEIGNEGEHIKYGNKVPCQPRKEISKPLDKLYRKLIGFLRIVVWHMRVSARLIKVT